jgi:hypothetical protein
MQRKFLATAFLALFASFGLILPAAATDQVLTASVKPVPVIITLGLTYQQVLPLAASDNRQSITIQNNNANTDNCEIILVGQGSPWLVGDTTTTSRTINSVSMTGGQASILLTPGQSYTRYYPFIPPDQILGTCTTTGDSLYVDTQ